MLISPRALAPVVFRTMLLAVVSFTHVQARGKVDVIYLKNGDTVTGEIKSLQRGILTVKTDFMGTVSIEWYGVARVASSQTFELTTETGVHYLGTLPEAQEDELVQVTPVPGSMTKLARSEIVVIRPLESTLRDRFDASLDLGFNLTKANSNINYNLNSQAGYYGEKSTAKVTYSSFLTRQKGTDSQTRNDLLGSFEYRFRERWYGVALGQFQTNEQLGLDRRSVVGGGLGHYLRRNNNWIVKTAAGAAFSRERYRDREHQLVENTTQSNVDALAAISLDYFRYQGNNRNLSTQVVVWPSVSDLGRVRIDLTTSFQNEITGDLYWSLNLWDNFDSRPGTEGASKNDYGVSATVGYDF